MRRRRRAAALALAAGLGTGCTGLELLPAFLGPLTPRSDLGSLAGTTVELADADHRVVRTNVIGESRGLTLLVFFTVDPPSFLADIHRRL